MKLRTILLLVIVIVGSCLSSCSNKDNPKEPEVTLDALMDGTIMVLSFQVNDEDFYIPFVRVGDTYQLWDESLTRADEATITEKDCEITMVHDKANSLLTFYVREKKTSDLVFTAVVDIKRSTVEIIGGDAKYKVTNVKVEVSNVELNNLLNGNSDSLAAALVKGSKVVISCKFYGKETVFTFVNEGHFTCTVTGKDAGDFQGSLKLDGSTLIFNAENWNDFDCNLKIHFYTGKNTYKFMTVTHDAYDSHTISVNGTDITSKLTQER